ncbi:MAG TPA: NAD(P)/FAD-dependent oxidoreductase [Pyrinomonadaceae bacterium]|jgi:flavin-dependent dehydrogenase|nr:NAD(P)/FAD-dependent oxidoreductase [Pyrinomonadaceae bacterium]
MSANFDIAVIGAGPAGSATARRLAGSGCRVVLLERSRFERPRIGESLAPGVQPLLADLGVWPGFRSLRPMPSYGTRSLWGSPMAAEHSHMLTPYLCGWHVDRLAFDSMLAHSAVEAGAQLRLGMRVLRCVPNSNGSFVLHIADTEDTNQLEELRADFVVDASGRSSVLARRFGARYAVFDNLIGIAAQFDDSCANAHCYTLVEAMPEGWWYSAPVATDRSVAMLMTDGDLARVQDWKALPRWRTALQRTTLTDARINGSKLRWGPRIFSAISHRLLRNRDDRARWLAVGDAALAVDPISGSGVIRALRTAQAAAWTTIAVLSGSNKAIASYEDDRDKECTAYLFERAEYYGIERRWLNAPFWHRRATALERAKSHESFPQDNNPPRRETAEPLL